MFHRVFAYWYLVGNGWECMGMDGKGMIINSHSGSFPHSLLSTSKFVTIRSTTLSILIIKTSTSLATSKKSRKTTTGLFVWKWTENNTRFHPLVHFVHRAICKRHIWHSVMENSPHSLKMANRGTQNQAFLYHLEDWTKTWCCPSNHYGLVVKSHFSW